jgi:hypothetical protein
VKRCCIAVFHCKFGGLMASEKWFAAEGKVRGVAIVSHGMNLRAERMDALCSSLAADGFEVLRPSFSGHDPADTPAYLAVEAAAWEADARATHASALERARVLGGVPLILVAYSFTAPVFQVLHRELPFARRIYLAPAFATRAWYPAVIGFARTFPGFTYTSLNFKEYQAHSRSGARPFLALEAFLKRWRRGEGRGDETPTLILFDPKDELLSYRGLMNIADETPAWRVERISAAGATNARPVHHLVVDEASLGASEWRRMLGLIRDFLQ